MGMTPKGVKRIPVRIIELLEDYQGQILTKKFMYEKVWGSDYTPDKDATIHTNIRYARRSGADIDLVYGIGYVIR